MLQSKIVISKCYFDNWPIEIERRSKTKTSDHVLLLDKFCWVVFDDIFGRPFGCVRPWGSWPWSRWRSTCGCRGSPGSWWRQSPPSLWRSPAGSRRRGQIIQGPFEFSYDFVEHWHSEKLGFERIKIDLFILVLAGQIIIIISNWVRNLNLCVTFWRN